MDIEELQKVKRRYNIVGNCGALHRALDVAMQVAHTDLSVLIYGESGVGKEIFPRVIHDLSPRRRERYFAINCGSIPEGTIDSELFGHEKGSFTGAVGESEGYFGAADRGTLFLDEVGELPLSTQARLLRVLETGEYIRVGGQEVRHTNVRICAATNVNLQRAISERRFREDLFYRLNTIPIHVPSLRERGDDIVLLFRLFAMQMSEQYHLPRLELADDAKQVLTHYKWPGNVRQLKNVTEQMSVLCHDRTVTAEALTQFIPVDPDSTSLAVITPQGSHAYESEREMLFKVLYDMRTSVAELRREVAELRKQAAVPQTTFVPAIEAHEVPEAVAEPEEENLNISQANRRAIEKALERNNGNRTKAAQDLGMSYRTLFRRLREYGINTDEP